MSENTNNPTLQRTYRPVRNDCGPCKTLQVPCDGGRPCGRCKEGGVLHQCTDNTKSPKRRKTTAESTTPTATNQFTNTNSITVNIHGKETITVGAPPVGRSVESTLLLDAQRNVIFVGTGVPLSLQQAVRQLVIKHVGPSAFDMKENSESIPAKSSGHLQNSISLGPPVLQKENMARAVEMFRATVAAITDFDEVSHAEMLSWADGEDSANVMGSVVKYLVLAIGLLSEDTDLAQKYFEYANDKAYNDSDHNNEGTIQAFILITIYKLCSGPVVNGGRVLGLAVDAAYSIGIHDSGTNALCGFEKRKAREKLWKSLQALDLYIRTLTGHPLKIPNTDLMATPTPTETDGVEESDLLSTSILILRMINEVITLKAWSAKWGSRLKGLSSNWDHSSLTDPKVIGWCRVLMAYYYASILIFWPSLLSELNHNLEGSHPESNSRNNAGACIHAASSLISLMSAPSNDGQIRFNTILMPWTFLAALSLSIRHTSYPSSTSQTRISTALRILGHLSLPNNGAEEHSTFIKSLCEATVRWMEKEQPKREMAMFNLMN